MKQAINQEFDGIEYKKAIEKWGSREFFPDLAYRIF
jgi:hypothetical protein